MAQYRTRQIMLEHSKLDKFILALWIIVIAGIASVGAEGIVDDICGTQTEKDVSGVERPLELSGIHGIELDPLPKFTYAATCGKGKRKITKCSFTSEDASPKTTEVRLIGRHTREGFVLKKDGLSYQCNIDCYSVENTNLWCTYPLLDVVCGTRKDGAVRVSVKVRTIDTKDIQLATLPTVYYDADCEAMQITKCSIPSKVNAIANNEEPSKSFKLQEKSNAGNTRERSCTLMCKLQYIARIQC